MAAVVQQVAKTAPTIADDEPPQKRHCATGHAENPFKEGGYVAVGLASHELDYPAVLYEQPLKQQISKGFHGKAHSGEEFELTDEGIGVAISSMRTLVNCGCVSIGHGIAAFINGGNSDLVQLLKERHVALEMCPLSNLCVCSTHYHNFEAPPIRMALDRGVSVILGTDDAAFWEPGAPGPSMRAAIRYCMDYAKVTEAEIKTIAMESFKRAFMPECARRAMMEKVSSCTDVLKIPICDLHMHFVGSVPRAYLEDIYQRYTCQGKLQGTAQQNACVPDVKRFRDGKCTSPWPKLADFARDTYSATCGVLLSQGLSGTVNQIMAIARSCSAHDVVAITLQIGAPQGASDARTRFYLNLLAVAQKQSLCLDPPCYISYQADFIRNAPVQSATPLLNLMDMTGKIGCFNEELCDAKMVQMLQEMQLAQGRRDNPVRFPTTETMYELLLLGNVFVHDRMRSVKEQIDDIAAGLRTFSAEIDGVARSIESRSPFLLPCDRLMFSSEKTFEGLLAETLKVVENEWPRCLSILTRQPQKVL